MFVVLLLSGGCVPAEVSEADPSGAIALVDANNSWLTAAVDFPTLAVAERTDLTVDWSGLTEDLRCQSVEPASEVETLWLIVFPALSEAEVEERLGTQDVRSGDIGGFYEASVAGGTEVMLSEFELFGLPLDVEEELTGAAGTLLLVAVLEGPSGLRTQSGVFLDLEASSTETDVRLTSGCDALEVAADLQSLTPVPVLADGPWLVSWEAVTEDCRGASSSMAGVDSVALARFDDWTLEALEADFVALEDRASASWTLAVDEAGVDLSQLVDADGEPFGGFSDDATWLLALRCGDCITSAPLFLTVLAP